MKKNKKNEIRSLKSEYLIWLSSVVILLVAFFFIPDFGRLFALTPAIKGPFPLKLPAGAPAGAVATGPTLQSIQFLALKNNLIKTKNKVVDKVLLDNDQLRILYLTSGDQFIVVIKSKPIADARQKTQEWFISKGFSKVDLCTLKIIFVPVKNLGEKLEIKDVVPDGCPALVQSTPPTNPRPNSNPPNSSIRRNY